MQVHRLRLQPGLQHIALQLLHRDDDAQHDERVDRTVGHERDQHRQAAGDERTDDRHKATDERDDGQGVGQRHPHDDQTDADQHSVDEADHRLRADESAEGGPHPLGHYRQVRPGGSADVAAQPRQEPRPVLEEEEGHHDRGEHGDQRRRRRAHPGEHPGGDLGAARVEPIGDRRHRRIQLRFTDVQRRTTEPVADLDDTGGGLLGELGGLLHHRRSHGGDHPGDHEDGQQQRRHHRRRRRQALAAQPAHRRPQHGARDQRQQHRQQDHPRLPHHPGQYPQRRGDRDELHGDDRTGA